MPAAGLELSALRRCYGAVRALDGLELALAPGELVALLGPSGCGKTTALRIVAGFERPDAGAVRLDGADITPLSAAKRDMGMVFQSYSLFPHLTAAQNVAFGLRLRKTAAPARAARAEELLELVGIGGHGARYPHQLSGGQQQRVALARALAIRPKVLLLDEPLSALDAQVRLQLRDEIRRVQLDLGITTLFVTHDQEEALSIADRVAVMRSGRLEQCAAPAQLYQRPATAFVAQFVGTMNRVRGTMVDTDLVEVAGHRLPVDGERPVPGTKVEVLLRPEAVGLEAVPARAAADPAVGTVRTATFLGAITRIAVVLEDGTQVKADLPSHRASEFPAAGRARLVPAARPVLVIEP
ncbi:ABC transporter ATP-binding protein [Actinocrinis puniceicyclus]|uniref:ABC-type quaternary amine transporter n=1 Tax=Actinocrinis puniceicyclus TaxID=977794 RepID=A0A8J8BGW4_9ACTN|nr:ABC transporter ATP-binding protein [Actinocrinis puniceicyclus]MBS2966189.1 ABC transporter ATP-binding protein [Actinocrinis puniceicyclus]